MPPEKSPGKPTTRRSTPSEKDQAERLVRQLREELGTDHGTVRRGAKQLGDGVESVRTWVRERDVANGLAGPDAQRVREREAENKDLNQEVRELRRANEMAEGFGLLCGGTRPPTEVMAARGRASTRPGPRRSRFVSRRAVISRPTEVTRGVDT